MLTNRRRSRSRVRLGRTIESRHHSPPPVRSRSSAARASFIVLGPRSPGPRAPDAASRSSQSATTKAAPALARAKKRTRSSRVSHTRREPAMNCCQCCRSTNGLSGLQRLTTETYGHVRDEYLQEQADRLRLE